MYRKEIFTIQGMSCGHCVKAVENELAKLGLTNFSVAIGQADVEYDENQVSREAIIQAIGEAGYQVTN